ncbi:MAG: ribulose-phosphate 3-epimerase [Thermacetogenium sp.]|nr:ribulose-phosphate 3-epimerase [Thermacetogenium sp.]
MPIKIAPSILSADFCDLPNLIGLLEKGKADDLHLDIMDGHFVPNITFGPPVVRSIRKITKFPLDAHLMVENPEFFFDDFAAAGARSITVHAEACRHLHRVVQTIKKTGLRAGVALNPATPLQVLDFLLADLDLVLVMTVNPGWGGQEFISGMLHKIRELREMLIRSGSQADLQVDGGINRDNVKAVVEAGANHLVIGSALLREENPVAALHEYRLAAKAAYIDSWWYDRISSKGE